MLKKRVLRKTGGIQEREVKRMEANCIMNSLVAFIPPQKKNSVMVVKLRGKKMGQGNAAGVMKR